MAIEAAELVVDVEVKGTTEALAELGLLDKAVDQVGDDSHDAAGGADELGSSITGVGESAGGAAPMLIKFGAAWPVIIANAAPLVPVLSTIGATAGGLVSAVPGAVALGGAFAYVGRNALLAGTHTDNLGDAFEKLTKEGTPLGEALDRLKASTEDMNKPIFDFIQRIAPQAVDAFRKVTGILEDNLEPAIDALTKSAHSWFDIFIKSAKEVAPVLDDVFTRLSASLEHFVTTFMPAIQPSLKSLTRVFEGFVTGLERWFRPMIPFIKTVGQGLGRFLENLGKQLGRVSKTLAPTIKPFFAFLKDLTDALGDTLVAVGQFAREALKGLYPLQHAFLDLFRAILPLLPPIGRLFAAIANLLTPVIKALIPVIEDMVKVFGPLIDALATFIDWVAKGVDWLLKFKAASEVFLAIFSPFTFVVKHAGDVAEWFGGKIGDLHTDFSALRPIVAQNINNFAKWGRQIERNRGPAADLVNTVRRNINAFFDLGGAMRRLRRAHAQEQRAARVTEGALSNLANKGKVTAREIVQSFQRQRQKLREYHQAWQKFIKQDPPEELRKSLRKMGPDAIQIVKGLGDATPRQMDKVAKAIGSPKEPADKSKQAVKGLNDEIAKLHSKTVNIGVHFAFSTTGSPPAGVPLGQIDWRAFGGPTGFAQGGIVTKPTLALVGEKGPEAIIPLSGAPAAAGGNKKVGMTGEVTFDWRKGIADLEGALVKSDRTRGW